MKRVEYLACSWRNMTGGSWQLPDDSSWVDEDIAVDNKNTQYSRILLWTIKTHNIHGYCCGQ